MLLIMDTQLQTLFKVWLSLQRWMEWQQQAKTKRKVSPGYAGTGVQATGRFPHFVY